MPLSRLNRWLLKKTHNALIPYWEIQRIFLFIYLIFDILFYVTGLLSVSQLHNHHLFMWFWWVRNYDDITSIWISWFIRLKGIYVILSCFGYTRLQEALTQCFVICVMNKWLLRKNSLLSWVSSSWSSYSCSSSILICFERKHIEDPIKLTDLNT